MADETAPVLTSIDDIPAASAPAPAPAEPAASTPEPAASTEAPAAGEAAPDGSQEPREPKKSPVKELQGRVGHLTKVAASKDRALAEKDRQLETYRQMLAASGQTPPADLPATAPAASVPGAPTQADFDRAVAARVAEQQFNAQCNQVYADGTKTYGGGFDEALQNLTALGLTEDQTMIEAALASGDAAKVLHHLGNDTEEAVRIAQMPPIQKAAEMARLAVKLGQPKPAPATSSAPAPIRPVGGGTAPAAQDVYDPGLSMEEYARRRAAQGVSYAKGRNA